MILRQSGLRLLVVVTLIFHGAEAAEIPDAFLILKQESERQNFLRDQNNLRNQPAEPNVKQTTPQESTVPLPDKGLARFILREVRFDASEQLTKIELDIISNRYIGNNSTYSTLLSLVSDINGLYLSKGVITSRAELPPQEIIDGVISINLIEGRYGQVEVKGNSHVDAQYVASIIPFSTGVLFDTPMLQRRIKDFNQTGGATLEAQLQPGSEFALTDVVLNIKEPAQFSGSVTANNEASSNLGAEQIGANISVYSPLGINDRLTLSSTFTKGSSYKNIAYLAPVGYRGMVLKISYENSRAEVIEGSKAGLNLLSQSDSTRIGFTQPIGSMNAWNFSLNGGWSAINTNNSALGLVLGELRKDVATLGLSASANYPGRQLNANLNLNSAGESGESLQSNAVKNLILSGVWSELFSDGNYAQVRGTWQRTDQLNIPTVLALTLGGAGTVRGYEPGALSGDQGYYLNFEWHQNLVNGVSGFIFYDTGSVAYSGFTDRKISSTGIGFDYLWQQKLQVKLTYSRQLENMIADQNTSLFQFRVSSFF